VFFQHVSFGRNVGVLEHQSMSISLKIVRTATGTVAIGGLLLGTALPATATTLNFDSITTPNCGSVALDLIPGGYGGFTWDGSLAVECDADYTGFYGNSYGAPSAANAIYNQFATTSEVISRVSQFEFDGAMLSGWTLDDLVDLAGGTTAPSVTVRGFLGGLGGTLVGTQTLSLAGADGSAALGYLAIGGIAGSIDTLQISSPNNLWLMDDFQYHDAANLVPPQVPEPTTLVLLGSGVVGLLARRRRTVV
jgi:hypothetical protein